MEPPLYRRILGRDWDALPPALQAVHGSTGVIEAHGTADVARGTSVAARLVASMFSLPEAGSAVPVLVRFDAMPDRELWTRCFAGRQFSSIQRPGRGAWAMLLSEKFGPFEFGIALRLEGGRLHLRVRHWKVLGIPLPAACAPRGDSYEHAADGQFHFHVEMRHCCTGLIVRYQGCLPIIRRL